VATFRPIFRREFTFGAHRTRLTAQALPSHVGRGLSL
jgi:hypothetical protein